MSPTSRSGVLKDKAALADLFDKYGMRAVINPMAEAERIDLTEFVVAALRAAASENRPALPKAPGISRDRSAPSPGAILVFFERDLTDDELRDFHDWVNGRYPSTPDTTLVNAPGHRAPGMRRKNG